MIDPKRRELFEREARELTLTHVDIPAFKIICDRASYIAGRETAEAEIQRLQQLIIEDGAAKKAQDLNEAAIKGAYMGLLEMGTGNKPMEIAAYNKALEVARAQGWLPKESGS